MRNSKRGIALITALLISVILMMMLVTLIMQSRQGLLFTGGHRKGVAALHVAEAGLADALFEINQNRGWEEGFDKKPMRHGPGNYTIVFNLDPGLAAVEADESVNNLEGLGAVNGPRGPGTVPAGTAELVVLANVEGGQRRLQVLLSSESLDLGAIPVLATGRIRLQRNVEVFALESLQESQKLEAGIHSNQAGSEEDVILWEAEPGDTALVTGTVSVTGNNPEAINFNDPDGAAVLGDQKISQPAVSIPDFDIATQVAAKSSSPSPPPAGAGAVTLSGGDFYVDGDYTVNGDLVLDGGSLYVQGNLEVVGSITGKGSIYSVGDTSLYGDATLYSHHDGRRVEVFSQGNIELKGFNGTSYLDDLAASNSEFGRYWEPSKQTMTELLQHVEATPPEQLLSSWPSTGPRYDLSKMRRSLSDPDTRFSSWAGRPHDTLGKALAVLEQEPQSASRDFAIKKLNTLRDFFRHPDHAGDPQLSADEWLQRFDDTGDWTGLIESAKKVNDQTKQQLIRGITYELGLRSPGSAYFEGMVYANGYVHSLNDLRVVGSVVTKGKGDGDPLSPLRPGDIILENSSGIVYIEEYLQGGGSGGSTGPVRVTAWFAR